MTCEYLNIQTGCAECDLLRPVIPSSMAFVIWTDSSDFNTHILSTDTGSAASYHYGTDGTQHHLFCPISSHLQTITGTSGVTWPLYVPSATPNIQLVHIGLFGAAAIDPFEAIELMCCLIQESGIPADSLHIITPYDINQTLTSGLTSLPDGFIDGIRHCISNDGGPEYVDIYECCNLVSDNTDAITDIQAQMAVQADSIAALEMCCAANTASIDTISLKVDQNCIDIASLQTGLNAVTAQIMSIMQTLVSIQECVNEVCGESESECIHYQLNGSVPIPPNNSTWLNLTSQIEDTSPPSVLAGPLWSAALDPDCTWTVEAIVRFTIADWCIGETAQLFLVACGVSYPLASHVITTPSGAVTLSGSYILNVPPGCAGAHLEIHHDSVSGPFKIIEYADFRACCG